MSGIYISGMEMPDKCGHCRFATAFDCDVDGQFIPTHDARRKDCPLIPVPDHGRLIDADKVDFGLVFVGASDFAQDCRDGAQMVLDKMPTIIEAEEGEE